MKKRDRCIKVLEGEIPDTIPVVPENYLFSIQYAGFKMKDVYRDGDKLAESLITTYRDFDYDGVTVDLDNAVSAEAIGCCVTFREDDPAVVTEPVITDFDDVDNLSLPNPLKDGRMYVYIDCVKRLKKEIGNEAFIYAFFDQGPFSLAAQLVGMEKFLISLGESKNQKSIHRLIDFSRKVGEVFGKALVDAGADVVGIGDALASPDVVSPMIYKEFAFPYEKILADNLHGYEGKFGVHICGNITAILAKLVETGADLLDIDYKTNLEEIRRVCAGRVAVRGTIDPASVMRFGTSMLVDEKCHEVINKLVPDVAFILSSGCDIMEDTPYENMKTLVQCAREYLF